MEPVTTPQHYLARRGNWQLVAQQGGAKAEHDTEHVIRAHLEAAYPGQFTVVKHPDDLKWLYFDYTRELDPAMYVRPAEPTEEDVWWDDAKSKYMTMSGEKEVAVRGGGGCILDLKIQHNASGRRCFLECKNQNDAGNAHERAAKFATASVISFVQKKLGVTYHPFAHIFTGPMVENRKYVVELATTYGFEPNHLFLWKKDRPVEPLREWLDTVIIPPLLGAAAPAQ